MKCKRPTPEQIVKELREVAVLLAGGGSVEAVCKKLEVSPSTYHRWWQEYGGEKEETVKRFKALEKENAEIKGQVADQTLDLSIRRWRRENGRLGAQTGSGAACAPRACHERAPGLYDGPPTAQHAVFPLAALPQGRCAGRRVAPHFGSASAGELPPGRRRCCSEPGWNAAPSACSGSCGRKGSRWHGGSASGRGSEAPQNIPTEMKTPVALIIFRRPDLTERVFKAVAAAKPERLLLVADGPREGRPDDIDACAATRTVVERVDWDCEVTRNFSDVNMGCGRRPASGIDWVFDHVEEAIILEDDCLPAPSFFPFCEELLERYRFDGRIMHINGSTYRNYEFSAPDSYFFSQFPGCWGWATWRRAWRQFDFSVKLWPRFRETGWMNGFLGNDQAVKYWEALFDAAYQNRPNLSYWDYQWLFACWSNSGLAIVPGSNLVSNVGGGPDATHTAEHSLVNLPSGEMRFPLLHPPTVLPDWNLDRDFFNKVLLPHIGEGATVPQTGIRQMLARVTPNVIRHAFRAISKGVRPSATAASERG